VQRKKVAQGWQKIALLLRRYLLLRFRYFFADKIFALVR
jgi:hypothetical protein